MISCRWLELIVLTTVKYMYYGITEAECDSLLWAESVISNINNCKMKFGEQAAEADH